MEALIRLASRACLESRLARLSKPNPASALILAILDRYLGNSQITAYPLSNVVSTRWAASQIQLIARAPVTVGFENGTPRRCLRRESIIAAQFESPSLALEDTLRQQRSSIGA